MELAWGFGFGASDLEARLGWGLLEGAVLAGGLDLVVLFCTDGHSFLCFRSGTLLMIYLLFFQIWMFLADYGLLPKSGSTVLVTGFMLPRSFLFL